jgi:hypothetical protein
MAGGLMTGGGVANPPGPNTQGANIRGPNIRGPNIRGLGLIKGSRAVPSPVPDLRLNACAAERIAEHLQARRTGQDRWIARCPAHADRAPSLSIAEGRDGRILLHCFAGCSLPAILRAGGLTMQQLFAPAAPSRAQLARVTVLRAQQRAEEAARRRRERVRIERARLQLCDLTQSAGRVARMLALLPDEAPGAEALAACYHAMLAEQRALERELALPDDWSNRREQ